MEENTQLTPEQLTAEVNKLEAEEKADTTLTKVTNLAQEEKKQGAPVPMTKEQRKDLALQDYIQGLTALQTGFRKLSSRGIRRLFVAALQLPAEGQKVHLQSQDEKTMFFIAQRVLNARTALILHYVEEAVMQQKKEEANKLNEEKANANETGINASVTNPSGSGLEASGQKE